MKKSLSLILCFAMLLSLGTLAISAADDDVAGYVLYANYGDVEIDGEKDDTMHLGLTTQTKTPEGTLSPDWNVVVGAVWNADSLYLGVGSGGVNLSQYQGSIMDLVHVEVTNESGYSGSITRGEPSDGTNAASLANTQEYTATNSRGASETTTPGYVYAEFEIPMDQLSFYAREDGSIATKVHLCVDDDAEFYDTDTDITVILSEYSVLAARDAHGATANVADVDEGLDTKGNWAFIPAGYPQHGGNLNKAYWSTAVGKATGGAFTVKPVRTAEGVLKAGVASVLNVDLAFEHFHSTAGPVEAENWRMTASNEKNQYPLVIDADTTDGTSNPTRLVLTTKLNENGENGAALLGYAIYYVNNGDNNEIRLYSAEATSADDDYVLLPGVTVGRGANNVVKSYDLRLEIATDYKTVVTLDGKYMGTLPAPAVTAYDEVAFKDWAPSELTAVAAVDANSSVWATVKNGLVGEKNAEATEILDEMLLDTMIPEVYGHQDTITVVDGKFGVRFISDVSAVLNKYEKIGYDYKIGEGELQTEDLSVVYESVLGDEGTHNGYLAVYAIRDLEIADAPITITVTPWVVTTYDEAKMYGESYTVTYTADADGVLSFE